MNKETRLFIKNLPKTFDETKQRRYLIDNKYIHNEDITDIYILRKSDDTSRKIGFIGCKTNAQANKLSKEINNTYIKGNKISIEFSIPKKDINTNKNKENSTIKTKSNGVIYKNTTNKKTLENHPALIGLSSEEKEKVQNDPRFIEYISITSGRRSKNNRIWDNDTTEDLTCKTLKDEIKKEELDTLENADEDEDEDDNDNDDVDDNNKINRKKVKFSSDTKEDKEYNKLINTILNTPARENISDMEYFRKLQERDDDYEDDIDDKIHLKDNDIEEYTENTKKQKIDESNNIAVTTRKRIEELNSNDKKKQIEETSRQYVDNQPYCIKQSEQWETFSNYGEQRDINMPLSQTKQSRGYAYITYQQPQDAIKAWEELDGTILFGRILRILPGLYNTNKNNSNIKETNDKNQIDMYLQKNIKNSLQSIGNYKHKKELYDKAYANVGHNWNSLFINSDTVANAVSNILNITKDQQYNLHELESNTIDDNTTIDNDNNNEKKISIGTRQALAETHMIEETKLFFKKNGVNFSTFDRLAKLEKSIKDGKQIDYNKKKILQNDTNNDTNDTIQIKNQSFKSTESELNILCSSFGPLSRQIVPPYKTMAIVQYKDPKIAKVAFTGYRRFCNLPLFVEWAPKDCFVDNAPLLNIDAIEQDIVEENDKIESKRKYEKEEDEDENENENENEEDKIKTSTIHVKNIPKETNEEEQKESIGKQLLMARERYEQMQKRVGKKIEDNWYIKHITLKENNTISLKYGFIELSSKMAAQYIAYESEKCRGCRQIKTNKIIDQSIAKTNYIQGINNINNNGIELKIQEQLKQHDEKKVNKIKTILAKKNVLLNKEKLKEQEKLSEIGTKLLIRNVPFEANSKEIRELFSAYGQIRTVKLPRKSGGTQHRGFAFVDFLTPNEARNAYKALYNTHLYGRHQVLEWASG